jgi:hypothetical protein
MTASRAIIVLAGSPPQKRLDTTPGVQCTEPSAITRGASDIGGTMAVASLSAQL